METFIGASRSVAVFEAATNGSRLSQMVTRARQVRVASWMVVVAVVSDDPVFLAAFAQQAREGRLLVWATRLIVVSRRAPLRLHPLHQTLALTNSLLLLVDGAARVSRCVGVSVVYRRASHDQHVTLVPCMLVIIVKRSRPNRAPLFQGHWMDGAAIPTAWRRPTAGCLLAGMGQPFIVSAALLGQI
ncbi:uncharacterized protein LOC135106524 [Scylla paramamosain]|uniref:uncharacterized protein LOC135106524 n=1 Tax=Scylla paramamosain TaxID=85552 RepID=UPI003082CCE8